MTEKRLVIMRHGKAEKNDFDDFDRDLTKRGVADCKSVGKVIYNLEGCPLLIVSSPAKRAIKTASVIAEVCHYKKVIMEFDFLYPGKSNSIQMALDELDDEIDYVIITGHNPYFEETVSKLVLKKGSMIEMPTSCAVCIKSFVKSWKHFSLEESHEIEWILTPRLIEASNNL